MLDKLNRLNSIFESFIFCLLSKAERSNLLPAFLSQSLGLQSPKSFKDLNSILFICKGNICRSAYANIKLKEELKNNSIQNVKVFSGGVWTKDGKPANAKAIESAQNRGIDLSNHKTHSIIKEDLDKADIILIMDRSHRKEIAKISQIALEKTFYLARLIEDSKDIHPLIIKDPYGRSEEVFQKCFNVIDKALLRVVSLLQKNA